MSSPALARRFMLGKYLIVGRPTPGSMHMLRYEVFLDGRRLGAQLSVPSESDCRFMECPPTVPPLKVFNVTFRRGRPKKSATRPGDESEDSVALPWLIKGQQRY